MNLRAFRRAVALGFALSACLVRLGTARLRGPLTPVRRALWLQSACRGVLTSLGIHYSYVGSPPRQGLVVSNHLSYLDILIYSAIMPCFFVSKAEVNAWPYFGMAARAGGTIFVDRSSRQSAAAAARQIAGRLALPVPVLLFPEGTSTDGGEVLRFHSTLFQPAAASGTAVMAASIRYVIEGGVPERELCWFGDDSFLPHLLKALGTRGFTAQVRFDEAHVYRDRRAAAAATHDLVAAMRGESVVSSSLA